MMQGIKPEKIAAFRHHGQGGGGAKDVLQDLEHVCPRSRTKASGSRLRFSDRSESCGLRPSPSSRAPARLEWYDGPRAVARRCGRLSLCGPGRLPGHPLQVTADSLQHGLIHADDLDLLDKGGDLNLQAARTLGLGLDKAVQRITLSGGGNICPAL